VISTRSLLESLLLFDRRAGKSICGRCGDVHYIAHILEAVHANDIEKTGGQIRQHAELWSMMVLNAWDTGCGLKTIRNRNRGKPGRAIELCLPGQTEFPHCLLRNTHAKVLAYVIISTIV
jgi:hypothetical protein